MGEKVKEISVFVDESGTFDPDVEASRFYLICMVFHDQAKSIADDVQKLNNALADLGLPEDHAVHAGPLMRWESPYRNCEGPKRRTIFSRMMSFIRRSDITYRFFHSDGLQMKLPCVPIGIESGSWQLAGRSRGMSMQLAA